MSLCFTPKKILPVDMLFYLLFARALPGLCLVTRGELIPLLVPVFPSACLGWGFCRELFLIVCFYRDGLFPGSGTAIPLCIYLYNTKGKKWVPSLLLQH